ncbi:uncharacterized protein EDB91DRAFT_1252923 [Suillus paluster]|uniref:uncharacterized protein n=1 Tax=Suillus paluster TaxID=48578 RepID=UPI001B86E41A|nr:uncharacterized protein EDB91DRAFT_1252923 [Suillus paluster]KAG1729880.1 hypothetical protein EDB91DRAFT_1252923 [Suillus paluster]
MSDIPPSQSMFNPDSPLNPELHYDGAGNAYAHDHAGIWQSHPGITQAQPAATPLTYGLTTRADFSQYGHASEPPAIPSGSHLVLGAAQIPLPDSPDRELHDPVAIAKAQGYAPAISTAGARRKTAAKANKGKGKENTDHAPKHTCAAEDNKDDPRPGAKCSWSSGSNNYSVTDIQVLLDFVEDECPLGQKGWQAIHLKYSEWARKHKRPPRKAMSLETKFKQLVKTTKSTGDGICPPDVTCAHEIDMLINERAGTHDLNDSMPTTVMMTCKMLLPPSSIRQSLVPRRRGAAASELLTHISGTFDPAIQEAWDEQRTNRSIANTQLLTQAQQL